MQVSNYQLAPSVTISECPSEVFCVRFSPDGKLLATGCGDGAVRVFNVSSGRNVYNLNVASTGLPTTGIRFRPITPASKTKNVLLAVSSEGSVQHLHITSGKKLHEIVDEENQLFAVDYRKDGMMFATAGKDKIVRVYDEATKTLISNMGGGFKYSAAGASSAGHSNRVFSLKFSPLDENILVSGGWDNTVQVWDLRAEHAVKSLFGPHICGDAMDIKGDTIVTGSWRPENTLETWDLGTGKLIENIEWNNSVLNQEPCMLYAAQFSKDISGRFIGAGGSGANEAKVFDRTKNNAIVGTVTGLSRGVFTLDFSPDGTKIAVAGGDAAIRIIDILAGDNAGGDEVVPGGSGSIFGAE